MTLALHCFRCGPLGNNVYLVQDRESGESVLVDAAWGSFAAHREFSQKNPNRLRAVLLTHGHWDHTAEAALFQKHGAVPVIVGEGDREWVRHPSAAGAFPPPGLEVLSCEPDRTVAHGDRLTLLGWEWQVLSVAGHTPGGVAYLLGEAAWLFSGDTLFRGTVGRSDLPGGDGDLLLRHIHSRLLPLDDAVCVYPGHGPSSTIGQERFSNPHLVDWKA
ncbi:MAG: MBL fold metallo-hydrolase [Puniceicoccales bacterium]|jgi:glyoxylase-like metal-dependent hydrolase (beta-lactamase superfamily II)|nr:MBL fold metallo-hydrolase [Puniceicoccales bacterium]